MTHEDILIIDDSADIRDTLRDVFELEGYSVRTAENGRVGLDVLQAGQPPCLVVLDLMMPVMDGWEFLQRLRSHGDRKVAAVSVVVVSGASSPGELADLERRYGCSVLTKPADIGRLLGEAQGCCGDK
ncbi:response regulator transcription factor [Lysobacter korlensis]|uniref:Response regulator transcription factor n=1 Tax=Lysobacter korlensis TaxID=553636 RepID=A0ABV6RRK6_9GAMM